MSINKPCPFCGEEDALGVIRQTLTERQEGGEVDTDTNYAIRCNTCGCVGPTTIRPENVEWWWNRRQGDSQGEKSP